jgi:hypothetical protein
MKNSSLKYYACRSFSVQKITTLIMTPPPFSQDTKKQPLRKVHPWGAAAFPHTETYKKQGAEKIAPHFIVTDL